MKKFVYKAKTNDAEDVEGRLVAESRDEALGELQSRGLLPISIEELKKPGEEEVKRKTWRRFFGVKLKERINFTKRMVILIRAGVPLLRSINIMRTQTDDDYFREILADIEKDVKSGKTLSESMSKYPKVFSVFYTSMVKAGERSGALDEAMGTLAEYYIRQHQLTSKVRTALAYPALVLTVGLLTIIFVFTNVMPRILPVLATLNVEFPLSTRMLMHFTEFLTDSWYWIVFGLFVLSAIFYRATQNSTFKEHFSAFKLRLPLFGDVIHKSELARFTRALEIALKSGIPITKAINIAIPIVKENALRAKMEGCTDVLERGDTLEQSFDSCGVFDDFVLNIVNVGEESGNLTGTLAEIAEEFEEQAKNRVDVMVNLLEPVIILFLAVVIGFIIIAVLLPIFNMDFLQM